MSGPLSTLRVVEFSGLGPAPLAGQLLADLGADVIAIDRKSGPQEETDINRRGKRSIALDLKSDEGRHAALRIIQNCDILIEGFRPGVMERLGLGPADCPETLIYGRMTGWGQTGPLAQSAGHDITYLAMSGALHAMGSAGEPPAPPLNLVADYGGGTMFLLFGLLSAVIERHASGKGQTVDAAMIDGVPAMMGLIHGFLAQGQWSKTRGANWLAGASHFYRCYECLDAKYIAVGALEPQFFAELAEGLALPEGLRAGQYEAAEWPEKSAALAAVFKSRTRDDWAKHFEGTDACVAPVLDFEEAADHPANKARDVFYAQDGVLQARAAPRFSRTEAPRASTPHGAGHDADGILLEVGYSQEDIDAMHASTALR